MKRVFIMLAIVLGSAGLLFAQKSNQKEVKQLQSFLQQKSAKGDANYIRLGITDIKNPAMWKGVVWSDGRAISIDWKDKSSPIATTFTLASGPNRWLKSLWPTSIKNLQKTTTNGWTSWECRSMS